MINHGEGTVYLYISSTRNMLTMPVFRYELKVKMLCLDHDKVHRRRFHVSNFATVASRATLTLTFLF